MLNQLWSSLRATLVFALYTGILFPLAITGVSQLALPRQANGSLIRDDAGSVIGSQLLAQGFGRPEYFHPRPSAAGSGYAGEASSGTNLGPTSKKLILGQADDPATKDINESFDGVKQLAEAYRKENGLAAGFAVPVDAVTRSASGLDPHISVINARCQVPRIARARALTQRAVQQVITRDIESRDCGFLGEPRLNVLRLNLELDRLKG